MAATKRKSNPKNSPNRPVYPEQEADIAPMSLPEPVTTERAAKAAPSMRVGEILKRERERRGYDLQQIADHLCIRHSLLLAIENSRYDEFPADAYVIGFLRSYADLIGLDGQEAIEHYRQEMAGRRKKPDLVLPTPISEGRAPTAVILGAAALASLLVYIAWYAFSSSDRTSVSTPPTLPVTAETVTTPTAPVTTTPNTTAPTATVETPSPATPTPLAQTIPPATPSGIAIAAPAPSQKTMAPAAANEAATPAALPNAPTGASHITIKADQSSWILIADDKGKTIYDHVMKPGEIYQVPNLQGLSLTTGNGAGIVVVLDGVDLPRLSSTTSHIVRNIPLNAAGLKNLSTIQ